MNRLLFFKKKILKKRKPFVEKYLHKNVQREFLDEILGKKVLMKIADFSAFIKDYKNNGLSLKYFL